MQEELISAITLKSTPLARDRHFLICALSKEKGLVSLVCKQARLQNMVISPFCEAELKVSKRNSEIFSIWDGTIINFNLELRSKLSWIQTAGALIQLILATQLPGKSCPDLYNLLKVFLKKISTFSNLAQLYAMFKLKVLTHEGLLSWETRSAFPVPIALEEWTMAQQLATCRSFQAASAITASDELIHKITSLELH